MIVPVLVISLNKEYISSNKYINYPIQTTDIDV